MVIACQGHEPYCLLWPTLSKLLWPSFFVDFLLPNSIFEEHFSYRVSFTMTTKLRWHKSVCFYIHVRDSFFHTKAIVSLLINSFWILNIFLLNLCMYLIFLVSYELTWPAFVDWVLGAAVLSTSCGQIQEGGFFLLGNLLILALIKM